MPILGGVCVCFIRVSQLCCMDTIFRAHALERNAPKFHFVRSSSRQTPAQSEKFPMGRVNTRPRVILSAHNRRSGAGYKFDALRDFRSEYPRPVKTRFVFVGRNMQTESCNPKRSGCNLKRAHARAFAPFNADKHRRKSLIVLSTVRRPVSFACVTCARTRLPSTIYEPHSSAPLHPSPLVP